MIAGKRGYHGAWWGALVGVMFAVLTFASVGQAPSVTGQLGLITIDTPDGARLEWTLYSPDGTSRRLDLSDAVLAETGGQMAIIGQTVNVESAALPTRDGAMLVQRISVSDRTRGFTQFGIDPGPAAHWLNLPCKFSDIADEPATVSEIEAIFGTAPDHVAESYTALTHGHHTFTSTTYPWATLPHTLNYYQTVNNSNDDMYLDCRTAHGLTADTRNVNLLFNADHTNGFAIGGQVFDQNHLVRATWLPPLAWHNIHTIAHEIGHGYGLPHSNNSDGDSNPYENPWDVMSSSTYEKQVVGLGSSPKPHNTYHVYKLGWLDADETATIALNSDQTVTIDHWGVNDTTNIYAALIPLDYADPNRATKLYVVEARRGSGDAGNHQANLPDADGVLIYSVDTTRREPAWLVGHIVNPTDDAAAVFTVGESYTDSTAQLTIAVTGTTTDGYTVHITRGTPTPVITPTPVHVSGKADLRVTALNTVASPVYAGGRVQLTFEVKNVGTTSTTDAALTVDFSEAMFEAPDDNGFLWGYSGTAPVVSYGRIDNGIYIRSNTLNPGAYLRVTVEMYPDDSDNGVWTMRATATHAKTDSTPVDNTLTRSVIVLPAVDSTITGTSLLNNAAFDASTPRDLSGWTLKRAPGTPKNDKLACDDPLAGTVVSRSAPCAFRFTGNANENSTLTQLITLSSPVVTVDSALILSAWVKAANVPSGAAKLKAVIRFAGTTQQQTLTVNLPGSTASQYRRVLSKPALLKYLTPTQVTVTVLYKGQTGSAKLWIDDLSAVLTP